MDQFREDYVEDAKDLINSLEQALLQLESSPDNPELIEEVFRIMHTLKGTAAMFGFDVISELTHELETIYDMIRNGELALSTEIVNITLDSSDLLKDLLESEDNPELIQRVQIAHEKIHKITNGTVKEDNTQDVLIFGEEKQEDAQPTYYILFKPDNDIFLSGNNPFFQLEDLTALGETKVVTHFSEVPDLEEIDPELCYTFWEIYITTKESIKAIEDVFLFVQARCLLKIHQLSEANLLNDSQFLHAVESDEFLLESPTEEAVEAHVAYINQFLNTLEPTVEDAVIETPQQEVVIKNVAPKEAPKRKEISGIKSVKIATNKLDNLMNLVSELVITQARLNLYTEQNNTPELLEISENIEKISRQLRDSTFDLCLIPIDEIVVQFKRLVRDLAHELNKEIEFITLGTQTALDKTIIERITDPIMHLLRNSLDHGIELPEEREAKGKNKQGKITLDAYYSGTYVHIKISDDGKGIDKNKIKAKAIEKGLIAHDAVLTDKETYDLIFLPGFSTAKEVTGVSGRGVGMDVVKRKIAEIRGDVLVESELDKGTSFTIKLPLTLSIIDGLLVKVGDTYFIIPLSFIEKCHEIEAKKIQSVFNNSIVLDGEKIPFFNLREQFTILNEAPEVQQLITVNYEGTKVGFVVDTVVDEYQAVLKPLGKMYQDLDIISGGTILGDGTVALVIDTGKAIEHFTKNLTQA
ncbi:chemotaxis protein CheA [Chondrinema litorale]|uniref:chemotaxis protein CheA n=1 Tax=Chondrinema litorale TaxID=2994555 RepID=UPI00254331AF|nr:chemotaxis protein CheA [Chondrinema litorale]UZR99683.1 chemotaxis protein CheA [Chondrinema litorale]